MKQHRNAIFAWILFGLILATNLAAIIYYLTRPGATPVFQWLFPLVPVFFALVGALITSRHPRNVIGLVMMLPGLSFAFLIDVIAPATTGLYPAPPSPTALFMVVLWFSNWSWLLLVFPVMFIMLLFPTGQALTRRWNLLVYLGLGIAALIIFLITFATEIGPNSDPIPWTLPNPIGFLKPELIDSITSVFFFFFPIWILLCAISLFVRFRRSRGVEREQIKWLFYAGSLFFVFYMPSFVGGTFYDVENLWNILLPIGLSAFPAAIAIAILRYRLFDIDIIIRKTLQYTLLTGLLILVYFGSVLLLQSLVENITGEQSPVVIVISTLVIAALFNPLRTRIQDFIDRRFYRQKYDAERALANFASIARDEVDLEKLAEAMMNVVGTTMQPETMSLLIRTAEIKRPNK